jgi:non-specific protein-tyrosine kinase
MELEQYLKPVLKWWWLLAVSAVITAGLSYFVVSREPPIYQSTATLMIGSAFDNPNPSGSELFLGQQLAKTYSDIAQRQPVRTKTMDVLGLDWLPSYIARPVPNNQLLEIIVRDTSADRAKAVANELANQLILQSPTTPRPEQQEREAFIEDQLNSLQTNIEQTEAEILEKQAELETAFSARVIADLEGEIIGLQSKIGTLQANYARLLENTRSGATNTLTLIEPAGLPRMPVGPAKLQTVVVATFIAVAMATGTAYLLEYLDDTVKSAEDVDRATGLPSLPSIVELNGSSKRRILVAKDHPRSPAVESFRALRASVQFRYGDEPNRLLLVTSAKPNEGKSTISANLAVVFAQSGKRVLLVDADLRRPTQHKFFGLTNYIGLSDLLTKYSQNGKSPDVERILSLAVQPTDQKNLSLLVSGRSSTTGPQILSLDTMKEMLKAASSFYDYIILDSPPLLAAADATILSTDVDSVLLIAVVGKTRQKELRQALVLLSDVNASVLGVVLNRMKASNSGYYYRYYDYADKPKKRPVSKPKETTIRPKESSINH